jgi:hypothetical protein
MTDEQLHMITAAVDGELSERDARRFCWFLDSSAEARALYAKLRANSKRLRGLPRVVPPADLHARVMAKVAALPARTEPTPKPEPAHTTPAYRGPQWVPVAVAASLLIGVTASSFWYFARDGGANVARNPNRTPAVPNGAADSLPADSARPTAPMPSERYGTGFVRNDTRPPIPDPVEPREVAVAPSPRLVNPDALGSPLGPDTQFDLMRVRVPLLKPLADFDREDVRQQLTEELGLDPAFRIDLFARDSSRGADLFLKAARATGLTVLADTTTMNLLAKRPPGHTVVVYTEALTAAELTNLFVRLNTEDAKISPRVFDVLHATPVVKTDETDLRGVLGTDVGLLKRSAPAPERGEKPIDTAGKPLSAGTADHIVKAIAAKQGEKAAVLLTWSPNNLRTPPASSAELKSYLSKRGERKPHAVPVLIVIRYGNG